MNELKNQLADWAERTVAAYRQMAQEAQGQKHEIYTAFYTQSDLSVLRQLPLLAILAINPNTVCSYADQVANPYWGTTQERGITAECFLKGNPDFANRNKWPLWKGLYKIFQYGHIHQLLDSEQHYIYTNVVNFNSRHPWQIPKAIFNRCADYTLELLQLLQPKIVLCLGNDPFVALVRSRNLSAENLVPGGVQRAFYQGSVIIKIPHTSSCYTTEAKILVGKCLAQLFAHPDCSVTELRTQLHTEIEAYEARIAAREQLKKEPKKGRYTTTALCARLPYVLLDDKHQRYQFAQHLELTINEKEGCIGIRHLVRHGNYLLHTEPNEEALRALLQAHGYEVEKTQASCAWLGRKPLQSYGTQEAFAEAVVQELKLLEKEVLKLEW